MSVSKKRLEADALKASRIEQTISTNGWQDILAIINDKYNSCLTELINKESAEARGAIAAITDIMNSISTDVKFGEVARERYRKLCLDSDGE